MGYTTEKPEHAPSTALFERNAPYENYDFISKHRTSHPNLDRITVSDEFGPPRAIRVFS